MNKEKLDSLKKRAVETAGHIASAIDMRREVLGSPLFNGAPLKVINEIKKDIQCDCNTRSLITDLIHALEESNQPKQAASFTEPTSSATFIFQLNETALIKANGKQAQVIARADSATSETTYLLHYCTHDGHAVTEWFGSSMLSQLCDDPLAANRVEFNFFLNQSVVIDASGEEGRVISRAQYATSENDYLLHYRAADGRAVTGWFGDSMISPLHEKQLTEQTHSAN